MSTNVNINKKQVFELPIELSKSSFKSDLHKRWQEFNHFARIFFHYAELKKKKLHVK